METYTLLREFADSWILLAMFLFFVGVAIWAFLPSQSAARRDAQMIPFRNETGTPTDTENCTKSCASCTCTNRNIDQKGLFHGG